MVNQAEIGALATASIAVATIVYTVATIFLWRQTRRQASLTREIFEATHRPHLALRGEVWGPDSRDLRTALQIRLFVRNHGAVPWRRTRSGG